MIPLDPLGPLEALRTGWQPPSGWQPLAVAPAGTVPHDKAAWRALAESILRSRPALLRRAHASRLATEGVALAQALGARRVGLYSPVGAEVETRDLANALLAQGILLAYPRMLPDGVGMDFAECAGPTALAPRPRTRVLEPVGPAVDPTGLDLVVVPALALRSDLRRLGRGGGHFDRYLPNLRPDAVTVGCAAAACILDWMPPEPHDVALNCAVTEAGLHGPARQP